MAEKRTSSGFIQRSKDFLRGHLSDSTAITVASTPLFAGFETFAAGISVDNSLNARLIGAALTYAGMGKLFTGGMDASRRLFRIKPETKERLKHLHDASYALVYNLAIGPIFYYGVGVRDLKQIAIGTAVGMGFGLAAGGPMGYVIDSFRDLTGLKDSERLPSIVRNQSRRVKMGLAAMATAASIALTAGTYGLHNYIHQYDNSQQNISQTKLEDKAK